MLLLLCLASPVSAQNFNITYGMGKTYDIPTESWGVSHVPGFEIEDFLPGLSVAVQWQWSAEPARRTETDFYVTYVKTLTDRLSLSANWATYHYNVANEWTWDESHDSVWYIETKFTLFKNK